MNKVPSSLTDAIKSKIVVPFVGLGVSLAIRKDYFPTWKGLLTEFSNTLKLESQHAIAQVVDGFLLQDRLFEAATECYKGLGKNSFFRVLKSKIDLQIDEGCDLTTPELIWELKPDLIITTNYDKVLAKTNSNSRKLLNHQTPELTSLLDNSPNDLSTVWHLHGHIDDLNSIILAPAQYDSLYSDSVCKEYARAAYSRLQQIVLSRQLLFIGFGLADNYVMEMLRDTFKLFDSNLKSSFALMKKGSAEESLWSDYGIRTIEYEDHGGPLNELLRHLATYAPTSRNVLSSKKIKSMSPSDREIPGCSFASKSTNINSDLKNLLEVLVDDFSFRWEHESFKFDNDIPPIVFWPVRLREPMAIHAVQAFAVAILQQVGADIHLCLDDFGERKVEPGRFLASVKKWIDKAGGNSKQLKDELFSGILKSGAKRIAWERASDWLGKGKHNVGEVLDICKIAKAGVASELTGTRGTGRLLTPATVWSCLEAIKNRNKNASLITFGGFDERPLWDSWKRCVEVGNWCVGNLYIPELSDVHMQTTNLSWASKVSIEETLREKCQAEQRNGNWRSENSFIPWTLSGCVLLPEFGNSKVTKLSTFEIESSAQPLELVAPLAKMVEKWLI